MPRALQPLLASDIAVSLGGRPVLVGTDLRASPGQRVGLLGENGSGKSTLLRVLSGDLVPDRGTVVRPPDLLYLPQDPVFAPGTTVGEVLDNALAPLRDVVQAVERLGAALSEGGDASAYADALTWAEDHDAWDADRRADMAAERLGVAALGRSRVTDNLSGGERSRLAIAAALTRRPACLLLDEPTNHLDDDAVALIEQTCLDLPGVVIVASHDRTFLDRVCTHLIDLDPAALGTDGAGGSRFRGSFSDYLRVRASARARWEQEHQRQQDEIAALRAASKVRHRDVAPGRGPRDNDKFVHAFKGARVDRTVARRAKAAERRLEQAERVALSKPPTVLRLTADLPGYAGGVVAARELVVRGRLRVPVLHVEPGGRLLVTGANGTGKSTLLAVLAGRLAPDEGHVHVSGRSALLTQDTHFADPDRVAAQVYAEAVGPARAAAVPLRSLGLLAATAHGTPVGLLSTGQQRRLSLAIVMAQSPDVLLLDEPSNHLSPTLVTELEDALATTGSTVVVATHDRWLRQRWHGPELHLTRDDAPAQRRPPDVPAARRHAERRGDADERLSPVCAR